MRLRELGSVHDLSNELDVCHRHHKEKTCGKWLLQAIHNELIEAMLREEQEAMSLAIQVA